MRTLPSAEPSTSHETRSATHLPILLTIDEAADLLNWLHQKRAPSPEE